jgi:hypothetical protein
MDPLMNKLLAALAGFQISLNGEFKRSPFFAPIGQTQWLGSHSCDIVIQRLDVSKV